MPEQYESVPIDLPPADPSGGAEVWVLVAFLAFAALVIAAGLVWAARPQRKALASVEDGMALTRRALEIQERAASMQERAVAMAEQAGRDRQEIVRLLEGAREGQGCRIFIGSENRMFALSGSRVIASPYRGSQGEVVGVVGVIAHTRLNYARVVPMVDFTAQALTRLMG